jgi:hypothetical protein
VFVLIFGVMLARGLTHQDPDFGWHLKAGEYFRANGVATVEPFTYTASEFPWVDHEAASDMAVSWFYDLGEAVGGGLGFGGGAGGESGFGFALLAAIYAGLYTLAFYLVWRASCVAGSANFAGGRRISPWLLLPGAVALLPFAGVRALTFSVLMLAVLIWLLAPLDFGASSKADSPGKMPRRLWWLPALFLAWANLHGSFVVGLAYLAYRIFYAAAFGARFSARGGEFSMRGWWARVAGRLWELRGLIGLWAASLAATFVNFYGWRIYEEVFRTLGDSSLAHTVTEWQPGVPFAALPFLALFVLGWALATQRKDFPWFRQLLGAENIFLVAALLARRHWPLFVLAAFAPMAWRLQDGLAMFWARVKTAEDSGGSGKAAGEAKLRRFLGAAGLVLAGATIIIGGLGLMLPAARPNYEPEKIAAYLRENLGGGNVFNDYDLGGFLIRRGQKVYIDGRMPSWELNGKKYMADYLRVLEEPEFRAEEFAKYNVKYAALYRDSRIANELLADGWQVVVEDGDFVLVKKEAAP